MTTLYVSCLPHRADEEVLRRIFSAHAEVATVELFADWEHPTGEPYALVELAGDPRPETVEGVVDALDGLQIGRTHLRVHRRA